MDGSEMVEYHTSDNMQNDGWERRDKYQPKLSYIWINNYVACKRQVLQN